VVKPVASCTKDRLPEDVARVSFRTAAQKIGIATRFRVADAAPL